MAEHLTEEEQVEALKSWWNENWVSIVLPIILVLGGYLGWNFWQDRQHAQAEAASNLYQQLSQAAQTQPGEQLSAEQKAKIGELSEQLLADHSNSLYANMTNLLLARIHVDDGELVAAQQRLEDIVNAPANEAMGQVATARLARVLAAQGEYDAALSKISQTASEAFKALYAEVRGDIYLAQGKATEANAAYQQAMASLLPSEFNRRSLIQLKLDAVAVTGKDADTPETPAESEGEA